MRRLIRTPQLHWHFTCDQCGQDIEDPDELVLLRSIGALPEESTYFVHRRCAPAYAETHADRWTQIPPTSVDAAWLL